MHLFKAAPVCPGKGSFNHHNLLLTHKIYFLFRLGFIIIVAIIIMMIHTLCTHTVLSLPDYRTKNIRWPYRDAYTYKPTYN